MQRTVGGLLPARLGLSFRWLFASSLSSNIADGVLLASAPLLVASLTNDPLAVSLAVFAQRLPWLLFSILAGAVVDRVDRRRLMITANAGRAVVVAALATAVVVDQLNLAVIYAAMFLLGTAETFADNAASALVPSVVAHEHLGLANARVVGSMMVTNQLAGPPIGAALFVVGRSIPLIGYAALLAAAAALIARIQLPATIAAEHRDLRKEIAEGMTWLWRHAPVRTLALTITAFNITFGASMAVFVLYAGQRLGVGDVGFGVLLAAPAVGGVAGAAAYSRLERRFDLGNLMRAGLIIETTSHLALALTRSAGLAVVVLVVFGIHAAVWGTTSTTVRQRAVPSNLLGRVNSVYLLGSLGAFSVGTLLGGAIADAGGVTAPMWFAFAGSAVITILIWPRLPLIAHAANPHSSRQP